MASISFGDGSERMWADNLGDDDGDDGECLPGMLSLRPCISSGSWSVPWRCADVSISSTTAGICKCCWRLGGLPMA